MVAAVFGRRVIVQAAEEEKKSEGGGAVAGGLVLVGGEKIRLLGFLFCVPSPQNYQMPPLPFSLSFQPIFIGEILFKPPNWSLNLFFLFFFLYF